MEDVFIDFISSRVFPKKTFFGDVEDEGFGDRDFEGSEWFRELNIHSDDFGRDVSAGLADFLGERPDLGRDAFGMILDYSKAYVRLIKGGGFSNLSAVRELHYKAENLRHDLEARHSAVYGDLEP